MISQPLHTGAWETIDNASVLCIVCESGDHKVRFSSTYNGSVGDAAEYFLAHRTATAHGRIVECCSCGFVFTSPRFSSAEYDQIYSTLRPSDLLDVAFIAAKEARFRRLARIVREHVTPRARFLDFGCGDGGFLKLMDDPHGYGFEIGFPGVRMAGRNQVVTGAWSTVAGSEVFESGSLDFVTAFDVLEHLPRIEEDIALVHDVLKPGGYFFASVPNISSYVAQAMGKRWNMLLLEHLWYFSPETLERLLRRHGFVQIAVRSVPFDAPIAHIATRVAQTFGMKGKLGVGAFSRFVLPAPAGIMLGIYRKL